MTPDGSPSPGRLPALASRAVDDVVAALAEFAGTPHAWLVGTPCFAAPDELAAALREAALEPARDYAPPLGLPALRDALVEAHRREGQALAPAQLMVTHGAKAGILAVLGAILAPGDELLHPVPCYPAYPAVARLLGARAVGVQQPGGRFDWEPGRLARAITPRTRALVLSSPANPDGATLTGEQARSLVELCREHGLRLVSDEAYEAFRFASGSDTLPARFDPTLDTVVQLRSASKSYAACGWRVGWVAADPSMVARVAGFQAQVLNPPNTHVQRALVRLPEVPEAYREAARAAVRERLAGVRAALAAAGLTAAMPQGGFYLWCDIGPLLKRAGVGTSREWCVRLARRHGVGLWPGEDFGAPGWVRVSAVATPPPGWPEAAAALAQRLGAAVADGG